MKDPLQQLMDCPALPRGARTSPSYLRSLIRKEREETRKWRQAFDALAHQAIELENDKEYNASLVHERDEIIRKFKAFVGSEMWARFEQSDHTIPSFLRVDSRKCPFPDCKYVETDLKRCPSHFVGHNI